MASRFWKTTALLMLCLVAGSERGLGAGDGDDKAALEIEHAYYGCVYASADQYPGMRARLDAVVKRHPLWPLLKPALEGGHVGEQLAEREAARLLGMYRVDAAVPALVSRFRHHMIDKIPLSEGEDAANRQWAVPGLVWALANFHREDLDELVVEAARIADPTDEVQRFAESSLFSEWESFPPDRYDLKERLIPLAEAWVARHPERDRADVRSLPTEMAHHVAVMKKEMSQRSEKRDERVDRKADVRPHLPEHPKQTTSQSARSDETATRPAGGVRETAGSQWVLIAVGLVLGGCLLGLLFLRRGRRRG